MRYSRPDFFLTGKFEIPEFLYAMNSSNTSETVFDACSGLQNGLEMIKGGGGGGGTTAGTGGNSGSDFANALSHMLRSFSACTLLINKELESIVTLASPVAKEQGDYRW